MENITIFNNLLNQYLKEDGGKYTNELNKLQKYISKYGLENRVFDLDESNIYQYFNYIFDKNVGARTTLNTHLAALKGFFNFLIDHHYDFKRLSGLISNSSFQNNLMTQLDQSHNKPTIEIPLLTSILLKADTYLGNHKNESYSQNELSQFLKIQIAVLYIKLSLTIPLKTSEMLELELIPQNIKSSRSISHNGVIVKIPRGIIIQIFDTIRFCEESFKVKYADDEKLFYYLYRVINKTPNTTNINDSLKKLYEALNISELYNTVAVGKKNMSTYTPESYKRTAIYHMLKNGVNILYLKILTGLDMNTLISDFDYEVDSQDISYFINSSLINTKYYAYL